MNHNFMINLIILAILVLLIYLVVSKILKAYINGIMILCGSIVIFNCLFPILYEVLVNKSYYEYNYKYILIYYSTFIISISFGYLISWKNKFRFKFTFNTDALKINIIKFIIIFIIFILYIHLFKTLPKEYIINPRMLYENTRMGNGYVYFIIVALIYIYFVISMFTSKNYWYILVTMILLYFTGSKARMLLPIEMFILYYFYIVKRDRYKISKLILSGFLLCILFYCSFIFTSSYLKNKSFINVITSISSYSDYIRNFLLLIQRMDFSGDFFKGQITFENNFYSIVPRILVPNKPQIFGLFRLSYMIFPEQTLMFKGAPSFGEFGSIFADFGNYSLIFISIFNFIKGILLGTSEQTFIKNSNIISFMFYVVFIGINFIEVGIPALSITIMNIFVIFILYIICKKRKPI